MNYYKMFIKKLNKTVYGYIILKFPHTFT